MRRLASLLLLVPLRVGLCRWKGAPFLVGGLCAFCYLVRPNLQVAIPFVALAWLLGASQRWGARAALAPLLLAGLAVPVVPWLRYATAHGIGLRSRRECRPSSRPIAGRGHFSVRRETLHVRTLIGKGKHEATPRGSRIPHLRSLAFRSFRLLLWRNACDNPHSGCPHRRAAPLPEARPPSTAPLAPPVARRTSSRPRSPGGTAPAPFARAAARSGTPPPRTRVSPP